MGRSTRIQLIIFLGLFFIGLPVCLSVYNNSYKFAKPTLIATGINNPDVLLNVLPKDIVDTTSTTVSSYSNTNWLSSSSSSFFVSSAVNTVGGTYNFSLTPGSGGKPLQIGLRIDNTNGILNLTVSINGQAQPAINQTQ